MAAKIGIYLAIISQGQRISGCLVPGTLLTISLGWCTFEK